MQIKKYIIEYLKKNKLTFWLGSWIRILYYNYVIDTLAWINYWLRAKGLQNNNKYEGLKTFKNIHLGKKCYLVGTGPSLSIQDLNFIEGEYSFSVNSIVKLFDKTNWRPNYLGIQDSHVYKKIERDIAECGIDYNNIFVGSDIYDKYDSAKSYRPFFHFCYFHREHPEMVKLTTGFSNDFSLIVYDGYSIVYSMLQLAIYMGFKEIYLMGCDCSYEINKKQHIVESGFYDKQSSTVGQRMIYAFDYARRKLIGSEIKIYNATNGGMLEVFERIKLF